MAGQGQGKKRVSIRQIAEALGVSSATVSLVLNGRARDYGLSEATEARVQLKAAEMGYSLVQSRRGSPGILIAGLGELYHVTPAEFVAPILDPLFEELIANGWHVMVSPYCRVGTYGVTPEMLAQSSAIVVPTRRAMEKQAHALVRQALQLGVAALVLGRSTKISMRFSWTWTTMPGDRRWRATCTNWAIATWPS